MNWVKSVIKSVRTELIVMSANLWFSEELASERLNSLKAHIGIYNPDILCVQECTDIVLVELRKLFKYCNISDKYIPVPGDWYGCVIFSNIQFNKIYDVPYPETFMSRSLQHAILIVNNKKINIFNTHFESEFNRSNKYKRLQYTFAADYINSYVNCIFCADTNIAEIDEQYFTECFSNYTDSWIADGSKPEKQYTYVKEHKSRLDRILSINLLGVAQTDFLLIKKVPNHVQASDHYFILTKFAV